MRAIGVVLVGAMACGAGDAAPVVDENRPDEFILDTSTADKRGRLIAILDDTVGGCADKGFDAVEFDNLDSFTRSKGALTVDDNLALSTTLTGIAHEAGLAAGQKNTTELAARGRDEVGFDFAVAEECLRWEECERYRSIYGQRVIDIEYTDDLSGSVEEVCAAPDRPDATATVLDQRTGVGQGRAAARVWKRRAVEVAPGSWWPMLRSPK